jgi:hypothetical protein
LDHDHEADADLCLYFLDWACIVEKQLEGGVENGSEGDRGNVRKGCADGFRHAVAYPEVDEEPKSWFAKRQIFEGLSGWPSGAVARPWRMQ